MKKVLGKKSSLKRRIILAAGILIGIFVIIPLLFSLFNNVELGNVALIPVEGVIMGSEGSSFGSTVVSSKEIVTFIEKAESNPAIKAIVIEINSPGGSAVASDEIGQALKKATKPTVAYIREVGASGGYWIASATDHIITNRMTITGSIGVISSYLEFSGLMEDYGVSYERLVSGERKDLGTPYRKLNEADKSLYQTKINKIHDFFVQEVSENRNLPLANVQKLATGEIYLGVEAIENGLIDELGDKDSVTQYLKNNHDLKTVDYAKYQNEPGLLDILTGVSNKFSFQMGRGISSFLTQKEPAIMLK